MRKRAVVAQLKPMKPLLKKQQYQAYMKDDSVVHKGCGGQVMIDSSIHGLRDIGFGFKGRKFEVTRVYGKTPIGYMGQCLKCGKSGAFILPKKKARR